MKQSLIQCMAIGVFVSQVICGSQGAEPQVKVQTGCTLPAFQMTQSTPGKLNDAQNPRTIKGEWKTITLGEATVESESMTNWVLINLRSVVASTWHPVPSHRLATNSQFLDLNVVLKIPPWAAWVDCQGLRIRDEDKKVYSAIAMSPECFERQHGMYYELENGISFIGQTNLELALLNDWRLAPSYVGVEMVSPEVRSRGIPVHFLFETRRGISDLTVFADAVKGKPDAK